MPREAKLFSSSSGSAVRGFSKFRANIPPRWIKNARNSRKRIEPEIVEALRSVRSIRRNRAASACRAKECQQGGQVRTEPLGNSLSKGELLSGDTYPAGTSTKWLFEFVIGRK